MAPRQGPAQSDLTCPTLGWEELLALGWLGRAHTELASGFSDWCQSDRSSLELHLILFLSRRGLWFCCVTAHNIPLVMATGSEKSLRVAV